MDLGLEILEDEGDSSEPLFRSIMNVMTSMKEATADKIYQRIQREGMSNCSKPQVDRALANALKYGIFEIRNNRYRVRDDILDDEDTIYWQANLKREESPYRQENNRGDYINPEKDKHTFRRLPCNDKGDPGRKIKVGLLNKEKENFKKMSRKTVRKNSVRDQKKIKRVKTNEESDKIAKTKEQTVPCGSNEGSEPESVSLHLKEIESLENMNKGNGLYYDFRGEEYDNTKPNEDDDDDYDEEEEEEEEEDECDGFGDYSGDDDYEEDDEEDEEEEEDDDEDDEEETKEDTDDYDGDDDDEEHELCGLGENDRTRHKDGNLSQRSSRSNKCRQSAYIDYMKEPYASRFSNKYHRKKDPSLKYVSRTNNNIKLKDEGDKTENTDKMRNNNNQKCGTEYWNSSFKAEEVSSNWNLDNRHLDHNLLGEWYTNKPDWLVNRPHNTQEGTVKQFDNALKIEPLDSLPFKNIEETSYIS